jgi:hypothetical protein
MATLGIATLKTALDQAGLKSGFKDARATATGELKYMAKSIATDLGISSTSLASFASAAGAAAGGVGIAVGLAVAAAGVAKAAYTQLIVPTVDYALAVGDLSTKIGVNAEQSSTLIQVMDDLRIENTTMLTAFRFMNANGIQPTIENLAKLSDRYNAITDPVAKAQFAAKMFGARAGPEMQKLLAIGGNALKQYALDAKATGLVINDMAVQGANDFYAMKDAYDDTLGGLKVQLGLVGMPIATGFFGALSAGIQQVIYNFNNVDPGSVVRAIAQAGHDYREVQEKNRRQAMLTTKDQDLLGASIANTARETAIAALEMRGFNESMIDAAVDAANGQLKVDLLKAAIDRLKDKNVRIDVTTINREINLMMSTAPTSWYTLPSPDEKKNVVKVYDQGLKKWFWHNLTTGTYTPAQHGLHTIVPPGFPNDNFMIGATSGEEVSVKTKEQQAAGGPSVGTVIINDRMEAQAFKQRFYDVLRG